MYKIRGINISDMFVICRCFGNQRNQPNHYETLSVQNNSTQKEIRDAFLKLSKELHPDIGNKGSHKEFVKLNEAYRILSKDHSRKQHDLDLKFSSSSAQYGTANEYAERVFYHDPVNFKPRSKKEQAEFEQNYYGIKGLRRVSNGKIALLCVVVCMLIISFELAAIRHSIKRNQQYLKARSKSAEEHYAQVRAAAASRTKEEQIEILLRKFDNSMNEQINSAESNE